MTTKIADKILLKNKQEELTFNEEAHEYHLGSLKLNSVTTFLGTVFPFDKDKAARMVAQKLWISEEEVLENWKAIQIQGTHVHNLIEAYCNGEPLDAGDLEIIKGAREFFKDHPNLKIIASEIRLFSKEHELAGTADILALNTETNKLILLDWKTSHKEIDKEVCFEMAKKPLDHLPNNKYYKYSMQLAVYQQILKKTYDIEIYENLIVHIKPDSYKVIIPKNLEWEAEEILNNLIE